MTKHSPTLFEKIAVHVREGVPPRHAAALEGVASSTYWEWRQAYPEFSELMISAEASLIKKRLRRIEKAGAKGTWTADAWTLERRFPDMFGKNTAPVQSQVESETPITIVEVLPPQLAAGSTAEEASVPGNVVEFRPEGG